MRPKPLMATFTFASVTVLTAAAWEGRRGERASGVLSIPSPSHGFCHNPRKLSFLEQHRKNYRFFLDNAL